MNKNKISRNAPCPCGSGKKYKRCCMPDRKSDLAPFISWTCEEIPAEFSNQKTSKEYAHFVEEWDESQGEVPGFMDFLKRSGKLKGDIEQPEPKKHRFLFGF